MAQYPVWNAPGINPLQPFRSEGSFGPKDVSASLQETIGGLYNTYRKSANEREQRTARERWAENARAGEDTTPGAGLPKIYGTSPNDPLSTGGINTPQSPGNTPVNPRSIPSFTALPNKGVSAELQPLFAQHEEQYALPPGTLGSLAFIESKFDPNAKNKRSSAGGLFQQIDSNWAQYGDPSSSRYDPAASTAAAAKFAAENAATLGKALGRQPTVGELYLAHQQGPGGALKLLSNPDARAADLVGAKSVRLNGGNMDMTGRDFANLWTSKADAAHQSLYGGAARGGPAGPGPQSPAGPGNPAPGPGNQPPGPLFDPNTVANARAIMEQPDSTPPMKQWAANVLQTVGAAPPQGPQAPPQGPQAPMQMPPGSEGAPIPTPPSLATPPGGQGPQPAAMQMPPEPGNGTGPGPSPIQQAQMRAAAAQAPPPPPPPPPNPTPITQASQPLFAPTPPQGPAIPPPQAGGPAMQMPGGPPAPPPPPQLPSAPVVPPPPVAATPVQAPPPVQQPPPSVVGPGGGGPATTGSNPIFQGVPPRAAQLSQRHRNMLADAALSGDANLMQQTNGMIATELGMGKGAQTQTQEINGVLYEKDPQSGRWLPVAGAGETKAPTTVETPNGRAQWDGSKWVPIKVEGASAADAPAFPGTSVEAAALNNMISSGTITRAQANDLATGKSIVTPDGTYFLRGSELIGASPGGGAAPAGGGAAGGGAAATPGQPGVMVSPAKPQVLPAEVATRIGMGNRFIEENLPQVRKWLDDGGFNTLAGKAGVLTGKGEGGDIARKIESGREALLRGLTGAGMGQKEADDYARRYSISSADFEADVRRKMDNLEGDLKATRDAALAGRRITDRELLGNKPTGETIANAKPVANVDEGDALPAGTFFTVNGKPGRSDGSKARR